MLARYDQISRKFTSASVDLTIAIITVHSL